MDIKGKINIKGRRYSVSSIISESFVFAASDLTNHVVSVNMSDSGRVTITIDGSDSSSYKKEIIDAHAIDAYVEKLHKKLAEAYDSVSLYYLKIHTKADKAYIESEIVNQINSLKCEQYEERPFNIKKPEMAEVEADLLIDAEGEEIKDQNEIDKYVASHIEDSYNYRLMKWDNLKKYHSYIQSIIAQIVNEKYKKEYDEKKNSLQAIVDGDPNYIEKKFKEFENTLMIPFTTDVEYLYSPDTGTVDIDMESPINISVPQKKMRVSDSGDIEIVKTTHTEDVLNQTISMFSSIFYIAWSIWNISTKIKKINITNWQIKGKTGICWFTLERGYFEMLDPANVDIIEVCKEVKHVFDLKDNTLSPLRYSLFSYAIDEGKYDNTTLLKFANTASRVANAPSSKSRIETPILEDGKTPSSINDYDCGYNLSIKPDFDYSFANWCLELIKHKECSLELFVKDFGMSLNAAKAFMGMLLYVRFVGEKYGDGRRKVLVSTEAELEYKLSWIYHNESWKY